MHDCARVLAAFSLTHCGLTASEYGKRLATLFKVSFSTSSSCLSWLSLLLAWFRRHLKVPVYWIPENKIMAINVSMFWKSVSLELLQIHFLVWLFVSLILVCFILFLLFSFLLVPFLHCDHKLAPTLSLCGILVLNSKGRYVFSLGGGGGLGNLGIFFPKKYWPSLAF